MIASLTGEIQELTPNTCILRAGGVGYDCQIPFSTYRVVKDLSGPVTLWIHTHVREDTLSLYGFSTRDEKILFTRLIAINGVGPKVALCILSGLTAQEFVRAVQEQDTAALSAIPGIGPKTAGRIVFELRGKIDIMDDETPRSMLRNDAVSALENLGYSSKQASKVIGSLLKDVSPETDLESLILRALKELSP